MIANRWRIAAAGASRSGPYSDAFDAIAVLMFVSTAIPLSNRRPTAPAAVTEPA